MLSLSSSDARPPHSRVCDAVTRARSHLPRVTSEVVNTTRSLSPPPTRDDAARSRPLKKKARKRKTSLAVLSRPSLPESHKQKKELREYFFAVFKERSLWPSEQFSSLAARHDTECRTSEALDTLVRARARAFLMRGVWLFWGGALRVGVSGAGLSTFLVIFWADKRQTKTALRTSPFYLGGEVGEIRNVNTFADSGERKADGRWWKPDFDHVCMSTT